MSPAHRRDQTRGYRSAVRQQDLARRNDDPGDRDQHPDSGRRQHLHRRDDEGAAFDRGNRGVRVRAPEEAGRKASSSMTDQDSITRGQIAERLKEARKLAGLSQGHVARILGLHRPSISEIEAGNRRISADELAKLAALYDVSVAWLLREVPDSVDAEDPRLELAARELSKLKPDDLQRLLNLLAVMRNDKDEGSGG